VVDRSHSTGMVRTTATEFDFLAYNEPIIEEFRANKGIVGGAFEGKPLALITTTGAKSGRARVSPVSYVNDGDRVVIAATNAGFDRHPSWYHNLRANPKLTVEILTERWSAVAEEVHGAEWERLWGLLVESNHRIGRYGAKARCPIPVLVLVRRAA
jgi:deazaflavin-dependent oxidoreductase (nitroreductase family)